MTKAKNELYCQSFLWKLLLDLLDKTKLETPFYYLRKSIWHLWVSAICVTVLRRYVTISGHYNFSLIHNVG